MNCDETRTAIGDCDFAKGHHTLSPACEAHLAGCAECREVASDKSLSDLLSAVSDTEVPFGLEERIFSKALGVTSTPAKRTVTWLYATAASVLLVIALTVFNVVTAPPPAVSDVTMTVDEVKPIRFMLSSASALPDAQIKIAMSDNVAMAGFDSVRELSWFTTIKQGDNLLVLPVQLLQPTKGKIELRLEHGGSSKTYVIRIAPNKNVASGSAAVSI